MKLWEERGLASRLQARFFFSVWFEVEIYLYLFLCKSDQFSPIPFIELLIFHLWPAVLILPHAKFPCVRGFLILAHVLICLFLQQAEIF